MAARHALRRIGFASLRASSARLAPSPQNRGFASAADDVLRVPGGVRMSCLDERRE